MAAMNPCPTGDGGNRELINLNEQLVLDATVAAVAVRGTALGGEDDSHVSPSHRDGDVAGS